MEALLKLYDDKEPVNKSLKYMFDDTTTIENLKKKIEEHFNLPIDYQLIFLGEVLLHEKFSSDTVVAAGMKDRDVLIVKHESLVVWKNYLLSCNQALKGHALIKKKSAKQTLDFSKILDTNNFFHVYPSFVEEYLTLYEQVILIAGTTLEDMKEVAKEFFGRMFLRSDITFSPKLGGDMLGTVVHVTYGNEIKKYFMKSNDATESDSFSKRIPPESGGPDLRELAAYKILEKIGAGLKVFFPYERSKRMHYIATEEVTGLKLVKDIEEKLLQQRIIVQVHLLSLIMGIIDMHSENFGADGSGNLCIVDFWIPQAHTYKNHRISQHYFEKNKFHYNSTLNMLKDSDIQERCNVAEIALPQWKAIKDINCDIILKEKNDLKSDSINKFEYDLYDVDQYIEDIKQNYTLIVEEISERKQLSQL